MTVLAVNVTTIQGLLTLTLGVVGAAAGIYATRQSILSGRRAADAERDANQIRERTVNKEDFEAVVDGLRGVVSERTAQYNDLLAEHRTEQAEHRATRDRLAVCERRVDEIEAENRALNRRMTARGEHS